MSTVICRSPFGVIKRKPNGEVRWCFYCRARVAFDFVVRGNTDPDYDDYYGPAPSIECAEKGHGDGDMFPGRYREWDE